ncbi:hypothetical protein [Shewanella fidelis]|uniref:Extradiol ring-cleavage dioxygenase LigAB LigA subunit domain-containing protein n=1 Tax=Shewanella fidelis TaxID=173509 RepID=A0AAW8NMX8_9GAMM|nr:hypothetical protein [Shewanella fidelis]MDR8524558.1 hypothetical protein [Shewanella fidelis]MDW4812034.1 hypothetical protein [Shewanella fidelis]MDW4817512.1 hypothetical protein [Shewanella fidelis]MDW4821579.1 hypothetical protein [Shewanella fidelis]MDW4822640.1 hypothetical protein [Shewanella fidelis]
MSKFNDFFEKFGSDAKLLEEYKQDPQGVMKANGLTDDEIQAVMSGDNDKLKSLSGGKNVQTLLIVHANKK